MKQTFIVSCWAGGHKTYLDAIRANSNHTFYRVGYKNVETVRENIKKWRKDIIDDGWGESCIYQHLTSEDAQYMIEDTPDGYNTGSFREIGMIKDL